MPPLTFRQITFQAVRIDRQLIEVFTDDGSDPIDSIAKRKEQILINWLVGFTPARQMLVELLMRRTDAFYATEVVSPFYAPTEGEIDLLLCDRQAPHETAVIECKRLKIEVIDEGNDRINKLQDVGEAVYQAKRLYEKLGFFQTYLAVISAIDSANRKLVNIPNRGVMADSVPNRDTSTTTFRTIVQFPRREELPDDVGIIFIELVQPSGRSFEQQGTVRVCVHHPARPRSQRKTETQKMIEIMNRETR